MKRARWAGPKDWKPFTIMKERRNDLLQQLFDLINCGVILVDRDFTILHANHKIEAMFAAGPGELEGRPLETLFMPEDRSILFSNVVKLTREKGEFEGEVMLNRLDGTTFIALLTTSRIPESDSGQAKAVLSIHDISKLKSLERGLRESERMTLLGTMLDDISHQIRNPILSIGGFARRLSNIDHSHPEYVEVILSECGQLEQLLNTLQEFIHLPKPCMKKTTLDRLILQIEPSLHEMAEEFGIDFRMEWAAHLGRATILVDLKLISKAIMAVFKNACEAFEGLERERVVSLQVIPRVAWPETCGIAIIDQGCGIGKHILPHIFDPFFSTKTGHVGMGLTFTHRICKEQGNRLHIESELGKWTRVEIGFVHERRRKIRGQGIDEREKTGADLVDTHPAV